MLPPAHISYTWAALALAQKHFDFARDADYRLIALAATGPDLIDKPLAWAYFYRRYRSAVLFAHTLLFHLLLLLTSWRRIPDLRVYILAFVGHAILDRLWFFPDTFFWPLRGWRFHVWGQREKEPGGLKSAYWQTFTRRPGLWIWELGAFVAFLWFVRRHRLYQLGPLLTFLLHGRVRTA